MKVVNVVGARPNFMKIAPIIDEMNKYPDKIEHILVHTGQHYDERMCRAFFDDLEMPIPDINLEVGSGTHAEQTGKIMIEFEKVCLREKPDLVIVVGDVNSTMACAITAKKLGIKVAHVEAGLRSRDMNMPEEINRLCTDVLCDYLYTTDHFANENLIEEGVNPDKIVFVGNVMIDTLMKHQEHAAKLRLLEDYGLEKKGYAVMTLHRPSNVEEKYVFLGILKALEGMAHDYPIIFPIHPRTKKQVEKYNLENYFSEGLPVRGIWLTEPLGYLELLHLNMNARLVITDSGGLQEETTVLGVPCITLRENTERPITCEVGTNVVVGTSEIAIRRAIENVVDSDRNKTEIPENWDGNAGRRIVDHLISLGL